MTLLRSEEPTTAPAGAASPGDAGDPSPPVRPAPAAPRGPGLAGRARSVAAAFGWAALGAAVLVGLWSLLAVQSPNLPTPAEGFASLRKLLGNPFYDNGPNDKGIGVNLFLSLQRVFIGFAMAAVVGIPLGFLIGGSRRAFQAVNPLVQLLRPVSPLAWYPIGLVVLKNAPHAAVFVIFLTSLWPMVINTAAGAASVPRDHRNVAKVFHFGRLAYLRHVVVPHTLPNVVTGMRLSMGIAWMVIVAAEMLSGGTGIGGFVWESYNGGSLAKVVAAIFMIGVVGLILDALFRRLGRGVALEEVHS
ncbi:MAG: nitrate/nitrite transport system permease protein [Actinomycetota bacterium]|jgi:nitrate/nitrite transport system permease protein|nr:nitrate/nitrite transport system permease protein [Actinomycetota bacterium]